jgi:tRNA(His) 5'-end guanylyltransferase
MKYLCENIQGCVFGYTQSDEISLLLIDYKRFNSSAWFDNEIQKMCSISASLATLSFNINFHNIYSELDPLINLYDCSDAKDKSDIKEAEDNWERAVHFGFYNLEDLRKYCKKYDNKSYLCDTGATFDSRVFNIPKEEVTNYFYWRQIDAIRNAIEMVGQANFSHKELHKKSCNNIKEMLKEQKNISMEDFAVDLQRGSCCYKETYNKDDAVRTRWVIDRNIPIFNENREYIEKWIIPEEE